MKKIALIVFLISAFSLSAKQADSLFVKANKLYQNENYTEALAIYQQIEKNSIQSDALFYNIANANYKLNRIAPAIYYYEKTILLNSRNNDAKFNLTFAKQMALDNIEPLPKTLSQRFNNGFILKLTYNTWAWIAVGLSFLFALLFLLYHFSFSSTKKRLYFVTSILSAVFVLLTLVFAYQNYRISKSIKYAIVFEQQTDIKTAPTLSSEVSFQLHEGTKVQLLEHLDNWDKIKIADGKTGWILSEHIKEL